MISREPLGIGIAVEARKHHQGDNSSAVIGFIAALAMASPLEFEATPEEKPGIIGAENTLLGNGGFYISAESEPGYQSMPGQQEPVLVCLVNSGKARAGDDPQLQH